MFDIDSFDLKAFLRANEAVVNATLEQCMGRYDAQSRVVRAMRHSLFAGGKRLRPILCLTAAEAVGGDPHGAALDAACALEMIHTYSLIHDDLPALDNDDYRRGRLTCHKAFDEATAILAGDGLLNAAFEILARMAPSPSLPAEKILAVISRIGQAAGCNGMIQGQMLDMEGESRAYSLEELEQVHHKKTGALIQVSVVAGACLGNGTPAQTTALEEYARYTGLAFQVADDILNVEGDPEILGKAVGTDAARNKNTYPALLGLEGAKAYAGEIVNKALQAIRSFDNKCDPLRSIASYIITRRR